ncbi:MAG: hypothetical protein KDB27_15985 [Planctomycetales bacterium]|nr:hypothetical protein [Planctomycetales bacterium]
MTNRRCVLTEANDKHEDVCVWAIRALANLATSDQRVVGTIHKAVADPRRIVREAASRANEGPRAD